MINFTVGPVQSSATVRAIGAEQVPYFRTEIVPTLHPTKGSAYDLFLRLKDEFGI